MTATRRELRGLEGRQVSVTLTDGTHLETCNLVSAGRASVGTVWVCADGADTFIPLHQVTDIRATARPLGPVLAGTLSGLVDHLSGGLEGAAGAFGGTTE